MTATRRSAFLSDPPVYDNIIDPNFALTQQWESWFNNLLRLVGEAVTTFIEVDTSGGPVAVTLLSREITELKNVVIKDTSGNAGANNITVNTEGTETIDGAVSQTISTNYGSLHVSQSRSLVNSIFIQYLIDYR